MAQVHLCTDSEYHTVRGWWNPQMRKCRYIRRADCKSYMDFPLLGGSAPLTPVLSKGQLLLPVLQSKLQRSLCDRESFFGPERGEHFKITCCRQLSEFTLSHVSQVPKNIRKERY